MVEKDIIYKSPRSEGSLFLSYNWAHGWLTSECQNLEDNFIYHIAKSDQTQIFRGLNLFYFRDKSENNVINISKKPTIFKKKKNLEQLQVIFYNVSVFLK